jgi:hypothetical protein
LEKSLSCHPSTSLAAVHESGNGTGPTILALHIYTLIETARLNDVDPRAWLADVLARIADHPARRIEELLPWRWKAAPQQNAQAA